MNNSLPPAPCAGTLIPARYKGAHDLILDHFTQHRADILIGTQMLAKGLDLPLVTLVGIILADLNLHLPDFRASERTFQLITQVAGRSGRSSLGGRTILQTFEPENYAIQCAAKYDFEQFTKTELEYRQEIGLSPVQPADSGWNFAIQSRRLCKNRRCSQGIGCSPGSRKQICARRISSVLPLVIMKDAPVFTAGRCSCGERIPSRLLELHPPAEWDLGGAIVEVTIDPTTVL